MHAGQDDLLLAPDGSPAAEAGAPEGGSDPAAPSPLRQLQALQLQHKQARAAQLAAAAPPPPELGAGVLVGGAEAAAAQAAPLPPAAALALAPPRYCKYYLQRHASKVAHVLFYVVRPDGRAKLAAVGTDVKLSGHFVYTSVTDMAGEAPPLRCTNRQRVMEWLAGLGAREPADEHEVLLPELSAVQMQQLLSDDPMWARPALDRHYTGWREQTGTLPDGRHFKHFYLTDDSGVERLIVTAEDGARLDRRYTYKAAEDAGGFCFENGKAVLEWLDFLIGNSTQAPTLMRRDGAPERRRKNRSAGGGRSRTPPPARYGDAAGQPFHPSLLAAHAAAAGGGMWGGGGAATDAATLSPQLAHSAWPGGGLRGGFGSRPPASPFQLPRGAPLHAPLLQQAALGGYAAAGLAGGAPLHGDGADVEAAAAAARAEVCDVFAADPDLLDWVMADPDEADVRRVSEYAQRLAVCVGGGGGGGGAAVAAAEASAILQALCGMQVNLRLLSLTGVCAPVASLAAGSGHAQVRDSATRLTQRWRRVAAAARHCADNAMQQADAAAARAAATGPPLHPQYYHHLQQQQQQLPPLVPPPAMAGGLV